MGTNLIPGALAPALQATAAAERIILQKRQDVCLFCSGDNPGVEFKDRRICKACASELVKQNRRRLRSPTGGSTFFG